MSRVELPKDPNYHLMNGHDQSGHQVDRGPQKSLTRRTSRSSPTSRPAPRTPHTTAPPEWIAKYKGKFDQGWDKLREETLARQIALGVVPAGTKLAPKPEAIKDWDKLTARREEALCAPANGSVRRLWRVCRP